MDAPASRTAPDRQLECSVVIAWSSRWLPCRNCHARKHSCTRTTAIFLRTQNAALGLLPMDILPARFALSLSLGLGLSLLLPKKPVTLRMAVTKPPFLRVSASLCPPALCAAALGPARKRSS